MKLVKILTGMAVLLLVAGNGVKAQTVDEIMEKHEKAMGGVDNWNKVKTVKMTGSMSIQGTDIDVTETLDMGHAMRMDISAMGMNGFTIVTNTQGWMCQGGSQVDTMKPDMVKAAQKQLDFKGSQLMDYKTNGTKAEYLGKDTTNNIACYKIKFTDKDGLESTSLFDMKTYYLLRTDTKVKQDDQESEVAIAYGDYKKFDEGVVMPMTMNAAGADITFKTIEINKPVDKDIFTPTANKK